MTQRQIVDYLLSKNQDLKDSYEVFQDVVFAVRSKKIEFMQKHLDSPSDNLSEHMITSLKTVKKYKNHIMNSLKFKYSNGVIEGLNFNRKMSALKASL